MKYRIIKVNYEPDSLRAPMYIAMYKEHWWNMWKGFMSQSCITICDILFIEKFYKPEEALNSLKLKLKNKEISVKYPQYELLEQGELIKD